LFLTPVDKLLITNFDRRLYRILISIFSLFDMACMVLESIGHFFDMHFLLVDAWHASVKNLMFGFYRDLSVLEEV